MPDNKISKAVEKQRAFFNSHKTKDINFRLESLRKLRKAVIENEENILDALNKDLRKPKFEAYAAEVGLFLEEIRGHIKKLKKWAKPKKVKTPFLHFPAKSYIYPEPYGVVLIIAPWNYPFLLLMIPLIGAISAGNCVVLKPADYSKNTSNIIEKIIKSVFPPEYITVFKGGRDVNKALLEEKYDYICFTGSPYLGRIVMEKASKNLTPITLELGGKSPCIVDKDVDIDLTARRIAWGKYLNAGQTCICPDYLFVHKDVRDDLIESLKKYINKFYGENKKESNDFCRIINEKHFDRLLNLMKKGEICIGGSGNKKDKYIEPTIIKNIKPADPIMQEEIFGPIIPIMDFTDINEVIDYIISNPKPLAFYYFTKDNKKQEELIRKVPFGGGSINDTLVHASTPYLPFGGVGNSGMGSYHGKSTFDTFTHYKSVLKKSTKIDVPVRYPPYEGKMKMLKMFLK